MIGKLFYFKPKLQGEAAKSIIKKPKPKGNKKDKKSNQKKFEEDSE